MKNACTLYVVRHGQSEGNARGILQGQSDLPLTALGKKEAQKTAKLFRKEKFDHFFASDLSRAKQTAEIIALDHDMAVVTSKLLRERQFGKFEGVKVERYIDELKEELDRWNAMNSEDHSKHKLSDDIESDEEIATRFIRFVREVAVAYAKKKVLLATHGGIMRAFLIRVGFSNHNHLMPGSIKNLGYFVLKSDGVEFEILKTEKIELF